MASITIKNLPEEVHGALKNRARENGRSLNGEVLSCLKAAVSASTVDARKALADIDRVRKADATRLDPALLRTARETGRP